MPKMYLHSQAGTFTTDARAHVAAQLSDLGMACERLADTPQVRAGVWVWFVDHAPGTVFRAGKLTQQPIMTLKVYTIKGGLDAASRTRLIEQATRILGEYSDTAGGQIPAFVVVLEVPEENWGMYGEPVHLAAMLAKG